MPLILELPAEAETRLSRRAKTNNQTLEEYAREILLRDAEQSETASYVPVSMKQPRILELRGLGAEIWNETGDAQEWVNKQRDVWEKEY